jgi:phosphoglycolate phosphatase
VLRAEALDPRETVMVGDRSHDMVGARANSLRGVGVLWGYGSRGELETAGADTLVRTPAALPTAVPIP